MTNSALLQSIADIVRKEHGGKIMFDEALTVKANPHSWPVLIYGIEIGPDAGVWLMDASEKWHKLEETDGNFLMVANSIVQRLKSLSGVKN